MVTIKLQVRWTLSNPAGEANKLMVMLANEATRMPRRGGGGGLND